jgi:SanA protein
MTRRTARRLVLAAAAAVAAGLAAVVAANLVVVWSAASHTVGLDDLPRRQAAIVLGAWARPDGEPSDALADRLEAGLELYRAGVVGKLLLSGDHGREKYDEVNAMRRYVLEAGVPREDVFLDHAGFSTYETMYRARDVFQVRDAVIVTQDFHLARSVYTARALGIDAVGYRAAPRRYTTTLRMTVREWLARCKALLELHALRPAPRYLGEAIPITGDGRATWDEFD